MPVLLALDQGTTSSRAIAFAENATVIATAQREFPQYFPQPGWVEHDANEIWHTQRDVAAEVIRQLGDETVAAIGITNQRETTVLWNRKTGAPIAPAIVWQDRRTAATCEALVQSGAGPLVSSKTGLVIDAYFSATKIRWLLDHVEGAKEMAARGELAFGTMDSWLVYQLTAGKVHATDVSNASRTLLFNIHTLDWDTELLSLFGVPPSLLPKIVSSSGVIGETACAGLPTGIAIAGLAGDQQSALFGQRCYGSGQAKNTYGTGCFMLMNTGNEPATPQHGLLTTVAWRVGGNTQYALEGSVFVAGAAVQWLRDGLGIIETSAEMEALAASVPDSGGVMFVPAFAGLGSPGWDASARGTIVGLTRGTSRAHLARATLEAIALQSTDVFRAMAATTGIALTELRVDGGATSNGLLMQMQADLLGVPVVRPAVAETTALGAAYLAGIGVGLWRDTDSIAALPSAQTRWGPAISRDAAEATISRWHMAVARAKGWA
jgi:glycerol kinase